MEQNQLPDTDWRTHFSQEEIDSLFTFRSWHSWLTILTNWGIIAASMLLVAKWTNPFSILFALFLIGGRQLGCAVIMHEAAHHTLFKNRRLNDWAGNWLGAYPIWSDSLPYRRYHLLHHAHTGTRRDPDLSLITPFPITRTSLWRKIGRDLSGQTGWKQTKLVLMRDLGLRNGQRTKGLKQGEKADVGWHKLIPVVITNGILFGACWMLGYPALYLLWIIAWFTTYRLAMRVRSIAEHALSGPAENPLRNTRSVLASWWERLFFAPNGVHYHLEHHLLMTVPHYNLPKFQRMLKDKGILRKALIANSYFEVLRQASAKPA